MQWKTVFFIMFVIVVYIMFELCNKYRIQSNEMFNVWFFLLCVCVCVHTQTSTGAKPFKCVWSMPTWPESRICIISCSVVWIDRRIKWLVKESFMLLFSFSPHTKPCSIDCKDTHLSLNVCLCDLSLILRYATGTSWRSSQVSVAFYGVLLWFFVALYTMWY